MANSAQLNREKTGGEDDMTNFKRIAMGLAPIAVLAMALAGRQWP